MFPELKRELEGFIETLTSKMQKIREDIENWESTKNLVVFLKDKNDATQFIKECDMFKNVNKAGLKSNGLAKMMLMARNTNNPSKDLILKMYDKYMEAVVEEMNLFADLVAEGCKTENDYLDICNLIKDSTEVFKGLCIKTLGF